MRATERIVVVGAGLIGGSVALGMRRAGVSVPIEAFEPAPACADAARGSGAFIRVLERPIEPDDVADGDLVILAVPVGAIVTTLETMGEFAGRDVVVTDVGSTKRTVMAAAGRLGSRFVGGHPMAGSEKSGAGAASADQFEGAAWAVVGEEGAAMTRVTEMVRRLGAVPVRMTAEDHDRHVARVSHVPQLVSCALARVAGGVDGPFSGGPGLASMTRLADSPWSVWGDILEANGDEVVAPLDDLIDELTRIRERLASGETSAIEELFNR